MPLSPGYDIQRFPQEAKRHIGFIPDRPFVYDKLSGRDSDALLAICLAWTRKSVPRAANDLLALFELTGWSDELIETYSHGMRQKIAMSAALLHQPRVLVVDEPMVGLDPEGGMFSETYSAQFV